MTRLEARQAIQDALAALDGGDLRPGAAALFDTLGYRSNRQLAGGDDPADFLDLYDHDGRLNRAKALVDDWRSVALLFQLTDDDIRRRGQLALFDSAGRRVDDAIIESYVFVAVDLGGAGYSRTQLATITREINKIFPMPVLVLFRARNRVSLRNPVSDVSDAVSDAGTLLTLAVINRRLHKRDSAKDVLAKVTLVKDIRAARPHRAHIEILDDLSLDRLAAAHGVTNFVELHHAWQKALDSSELNKRFFREIADWYFWAVSEVVFPAGAGPDETRNPTAVIRLLTRLIFVWFLKEKGLVPDELFSKRALDKVLTWDDPQGSAFYKAILQNLFFATLNQEMGAGRRFRGKNPDGRDQHYGVPNVYRYEDTFIDPRRAPALFAAIPFLNGGLFECLDRPAEGVRVDGFSDRADNPLRVPDELFFSEEREIDLNPVYDTANKRYRVRGLIRILDRYKFTIDENTPIEEEIALDPELLGKVFENLLAAYNPETGTTARKATGSFYTPREIVNYMVDEALLAYLESAVPVRSSDFSRSEDVTEVTTTNLAGRLRHLLAYNDDPHQFSAAEVEALIAAIDRANILDPACGSGAFPMGILHKLVFVLGKLDPGNERWKARQLARVAGRDNEAEARAAIDEAFAESDDYARKLFLIENNLYGVDIQPIAVQIAKLRAFISLMIEEKTDDAEPNRGVTPLPNLETKFVAANTLLGIDRGTAQLGLLEHMVRPVKDALAMARQNYFNARTPATKAKYRAEDTRLRAELGELLAASGLPATATAQLAGWDPYDQNSHADFFDPEWMFGLNEGFDILIANPPYGADLGSASLAILDRKYKKYRSPTKNSAIYFTYLSKDLSKPNGVIAFIVPKSLCYSSGWHKCAEFISIPLQRLIDMGKAFENVKLEQVVFIAKYSSTDKKYITGSYDGKKIIELTYIEKRVFFETGVLLAGQSYHELKLILKILGSCPKKTKDFAWTERGLNWQSKVKKRQGSTPIHRGAQLNPYKLEPATDFINLDEFNIKDYGYQLKPKILNQLAIAHVKNPYPHFFLQAALDQEGTTLVFETIACTFLKNEDMDIRFILGLNNSRLFAWLVYKFVYSTAIRSTRYDDQYIGKVPVPIIEPAMENKVVRIVDEIHNKLQESFDSDISLLMAQIDNIVYEMYDLTDTEIALVEGLVVSESDDNTFLQVIDANMEDGATDEIYHRIDTKPIPTAAPLLFTGQAPTGSFTERKETVEKLAKERSPEATQHLAAALADDNATIRWLAASSLKRFGMAAVPVVRAFLAHTDDSEARAEAEAVLAAIDS